MTDRDNSKAKFLDYLTLKFLNSKLEREYNTTFSSERIKSNKILGIIFLLFSITLWIWLMILNSMLDDEKIQMGVRVVPIKELNVTGHITAEVLKNANIYYKKFILVNITQWEEFNKSTKFNENNFNNSEIIFPKEVFAEINQDLVRNSYFIENGRPTSSGNFILHSLTLILILILKNEMVHKYLFIFLYFISDINFHILSGLLLAFYHFNSNAILFTVVIQHFARILIIFYRKINWLLIIIACGLSVSFEWAFLVVVHYSAHETLIFYLSISTIIHIASLIMSYYIEFKNKNEFYLIRRMNFDREYLMNFLYNMDRGFITLNNKEILFLNKSMDRIIDNYSKLTNNVHCSYLECNHENNNLRNETFSLDLSNNYEEKKNFLISHNFISNVKINSKEKIERILENLIELNSLLPQEILELFKNKNGGRAGENNNNNFSIESRSFNINKLLNALKNCRYSSSGHIKKPSQDTLFKTESNNYNNNNNNNNSHNFSEFNYLGVINFQKKFKHENENLVIKDSNFGKILDRKYQVNFRLITHENFDYLYNNNQENVYLEIMFSDISNVVHSEREKAINNSRSMYLSKIAHEFKNPLTSLVELSTMISEEVVAVPNTNSNSNINSKYILNMADYSIHICKIMNLFLKDFSLITEIKFPCEKCNIFLKCLECSEGYVCNKCNLCGICEEKTHSIFDHKQIMFELCDTFRNFSRHEGKNILINLEFDISGTGIRSQKDYFYSIFYNLIFNSYKNIERGEINVKTERIGDDDVYFEIQDSGLEIDQHFVNKLNEKIILEEDDSFYELDYCDRFNKFFNIYVAFSLVKKIGSNLNIISNKKENKYYFTLKSAVENLNSNNNLNNNNFGRIKDTGRSQNMNYNKQSVNINISQFSPYIEDNNNIINSSSNINNSISYNNKHFNNGCITNNIVNDNYSKKASTLVNETPLFFGYDQIDENLLSVRVENLLSIPSENLLSARVENLLSTPSENLLSVPVENFQSVPNENLLFVPVENFTLTPLVRSPRGRLTENNINNKLKSTACENNVYDTSLSVNTGLNINNEPKLPFPNLSSFDCLSLNKKRVLVIDDENLVRSTLKRFLKKIREINPYYDLEVYEAENCFVGIDIIYKNFSQHIFFDFIIIDEYMPFMKGSTLIRLMSQLYHDNTFYKIHFISHTAFDTPEKKKFILEAGADSVISKPVQFGEFRAFIENLILHGFGQGVFYQTQTNISDKGKY